LRVSRDFVRERDVLLSGEGFFDVAAVRHAPFLVHTGRVVTRVLGTRFDIRHYVEDSTTRVAVESGKVATGSARQAPVTLVAGMVGHVTDSTAVVTLAKDLTTMTGWTTGRLRFREAPVSEVLAQLSRWYGIEFQLTDSTLNHEVVTTDIDFDVTADAVRALEILLHVTASSGGTHAGIPVVILRPSRAVSNVPATRLRHNPHEWTNMEVGR
jgi:ferric-dicitrate binding protein FerR (iron transport regulator)